MTVRDYLSSSLRLVGVLASGEPLASSDASDALAVFSDMLDAWSTERLTIYNQARTANALVNAQQRYTIGAGGNWPQARPLWIDTAAYLTAAGFERTIDLYTPQRWAAINLKGLAGSLPFGIFYNPTFPLGAIDVWPVPNDSTVQLVLYAPAAALTSVTSLDTVISVPPGWAKALRYNLAVELAPAYGQTLPDAVLAGAVESKAAIKRTNITLDQMVIDPALTRVGRRWSITDGDFI